MHQCVYQCVLKNGNVDQGERASARSTPKVQSCFMRTLRILDLCASGLVKYADGCGLQRRLVEQRRAGAVPDCLVLLQVGAAAWRCSKHASMARPHAPPCARIPAAQHKPVYTLGKRGQHADFRVPVEVGGALNAGTRTVRCPRAPTQRHGMRRRSSWPGAWTLRWRRGAGR